MQQAPLSQVSLNDEECILSTKRSGGIHEEPEADILIIYTGGTIGMHSGDDGSLEPLPGWFSSFLPNIYEFNLSSLPSYHIVEWDTLIDSANFSPQTWSQLVRQIADAYDKYLGFVVLMGTDTMSFVASILSFAFENLAKPIILTGSQIPIQKVYTDARRNLSVALLAAAKLDIAEVCIFFDGKLLRGNRSKKRDNWSSAAFESPNFPPLALMGSSVSVSSNVRPMPRGRLIVSSNFFSTIACVYLVPGFDDSMLLRMVPDDEDCGVVLMLYGTGNAPNLKQGFLDTVKELLRRKTEIVVVSQCHIGAVRLDAYATGKQLQQLGLINGFDMTVEACVTKLSYLMGRGLRGQKLKKLMETSLRGELSENPNEVSYYGFDQEI